MISHYQSEVVKPLIVDLLRKEGHIINSENIKIWSNDKMSPIVVVRACNNVKKNELSKVLVYTNNVPLKKHIESTQGVLIFDLLDLQILLDMILIY
jgi:hypothetical protein